MVTDLKALQYLLQSIPFLEKKRYMIESNRVSGGEP